MTTERGPYAPADHGGDQRTDALDKATGVTRYSADMAVPDALHVALVRSPYPRARIGAIDSGAAAQLPGVHAVVTASDLPPALAGRRVRDQPLLASGEARYSGEPVAAVLADSRRTAQAAVALIEVDYQPLEAVAGCEAALAPGASLVHEEPWLYPGAVVQSSDGHNLQSVVTIGDRGAVEEALSGASHVVTATYRTPAGHQGYLEPQAWTVLPRERGGVTIRGTTKSPYRLRDQVAAALGMPIGDVEVEPAPLGGDFGGKGSVVDATLCAALASLVRRPVRLVLSSSEDLIATDARHPSVIEVRLACDSEGRLVALDFDALFDGGAYASAKPIPSVNLHGALEAALGYRFGTCYVRSRVAYSNTVPKGHMRSPGAPQSVFAIESALDELASEAQLDPVELRRRNLLRSGEGDAYGHEWPEARGWDVLQAAVNAVGASPQCPPGWRPGMGVASYCRPTPAPPATSVSLKELPGGGLEVGVPVPETGTGSHSVVRGQLAAALGVLPSTVAVRQLPTSALGFDPGVGASRVTAGMSAAMEQLAQAWRARPAGVDSVEVEVAGDDGGAALTCCAQVARVAVDPETGQVRVLELISAVDVAEVLRERSHRIQIDGGAVMGLGFACLEDLLEEDGQIWASNLAEFKLPAAPDVPALRTVILAGGKGVGPANIKAVGELTNVPVAAAVANAIADAVGVRVRELPLTAERVFWAVRGRGLS